MAYFKKAARKRQDKKKDDKKKTKDMKPIQNAARRRTEGGMK